jgi:hypothetical protein
VLSAERVQDVNAGAAVRREARIAAPRHKRVKREPTGPLIAARLLISPLFLARSLVSLAHSLSPFSVVCHFFKARILSAA